MFGPKSWVAAWLSVVDMAGLVGGASTGEDLGNAFLSHMSAADRIFHCVGAFDDPEVTHTELEVDPVGDMQVIAEELCLVDVEHVEKRLWYVWKLVKRSNNKSDKEELDLPTKVEKCQKRKIGFEQKNGLVG